MTRILASFIVVLCILCDGCVTARRARQGEPDGALTLTIEQPTNVFRLNAPIVLQAQFCNSSSNHVDALPFSPETGGMTIYMVSSGRSTRSTSRETRTYVHIERVSGRASDAMEWEVQEFGFVERDPVTLEPEQSATFPFDLKKTMAGICVIDNPGEFEVWVEYEAKGSEWQGRITSNRIRITVE